MNGKYKYSCDNLEVKRYGLIKKYVGGYLDDIKHGYGIFEWDSGKIYKGCWVNGK